LERETKAEENTLSESTLKPLPSGRRYLGSRIRDETIVLGVVWRFGNFWDEICVRRGDCDLNLAL
jgi:hypothetical protein